MKTIFNPAWKDRLYADLTEAIARHTAVERVIAATRAFDGKDLNKRIATAVEKEMRGWQVFYDRDSYGWHELKIWNNNVPGVDYNNKLSLNLGYKVSNIHPSNGMFSHSWFVSTHQGYAGRVAALQDMVLNIEQIDHQACVIQRLEAQLQEAEKELGEAAARYVFSREQR